MLFNKFFVAQVLASFGFQLLHAFVLLVLSVCMNLVASLLLDQIGVVVVLLLETTFAKLDDPLEFNLYNHATQCGSP